MAKDFVSLEYGLLCEPLLTRLQFGFLSNLVKVFPGLATRPLHLTGESYAGTYIVRPSVTSGAIPPNIIQPYILKEYFSLANPPVTIAAIAIGDGSIATEQVFELLPAVSPLPS